MFKRRLAVLGAVGVLVLTALGGSAMADEAPSTAPGTKVTCTTSDGKSIEFARATAVAVPGEGTATAEAPDGIAVTRTDDGQIAIKAVEKGEVLEAVPAMPATPADDEGFTAAEPTGGAVKLERATAQKAEDGGTPLETITVNCESK